MEPNTHNLKDVLEVIQDTDLSVLQDIYKDFSAETNHIYNYLTSVIKWKTQHPDTEYFTILVTRDWKTTGAFIGINRFFCAELFIACLEEYAITLYNAICTTKRIDWNEPWLVYSMYGKLLAFVKKAFQEIGFQIGTNNCNNVWRITQEKAVEFVINCPDEVYISELQPNHAEIINLVWPQRYINSQCYLETLIEMNGGYGVFLKSDDQLIAWGIRNLIGLGAIQTVKSYQQKGYGSLIATYLAKTIAEGGCNPLGTVRQGNIPSEQMFTKIGFEAVGTVYFITHKLMVHLQNLAK